MIRLPVDAPARSLLWEGEKLVDVSGRVFDRAVRSPSGRYTVVYQNRGTTGQVLDRGAPLRELTRDDYRAEDFDHPVALGRLADGREVLAHCPDEYTDLVVEDLATGERLTAAPREAADIFHSRLSVSPDGRHLLSAGWVWHPWGIVEVYPLLGPHESLAPARGAVDAEVEDACWLDDDRIAVVTGREESLDGDLSDALAPGQVGVWSLSAGRWLSRAPIDGPCGVLVPCRGRLLSLYGHPRLIDPTDGTVVAAWPDVETGHKSGSYGVTEVPAPVYALHPDGRRLAVAQPDHIAVIPLP